MVSAPEKEPQQPRPLLLPPGVTGLRARGDRHPHTQTGGQRRGRRAAGCGLRSSTDGSQLGALSARGSTAIYWILRNIAQIVLRRINAEFQTTTIPGLLPEPQYPLKECSLII